MDHLREKRLTCCAFCDVPVILHGEYMLDIIKGYYTVNVDVCELCFRYKKGKEKLEREAWKAELDRERKIETTKFKIERDKWLKEHE